MRNRRRVWDSVWNIAQIGRNVATERHGYGGSGMRFAVVRVSSAYLRRALYSELCIEQRRSYSSDMECGPVLESVRERAGADASGREHCAIVPVFYRFVMH